jgi:hypothetical protein
VIDERGEVIAVIHHVVDVSQRERAEAEVRSHMTRQAFRLELEERLRDLAEPVPMMAEATMLLGRHLGVAQVGFAEVEDNEEHIVVAATGTRGASPRWSGAGA